MINIAHQDIYGFYYSTPIFGMFGHSTYALDKVNKDDQKYLEKNKNNIIETFEEDYRNNGVVIKITDYHETIYTSFTNPSFDKSCVVFFSYTFTEIDPNKNYAHVDYVECDYDFEDENNDEKFFKPNTGSSRGEYSIFDEYETAYMNRSFENYYSDLYKEVDEYLISEGYVTNPQIYAGHNFPAISVVLQTSSSMNDENFSIEDLIIEHVYNGLDIESFIIELEEHGVPLHFEIKAFISKEEFETARLRKVETTYMSEPDENGIVTNYERPILNKHYNYYVNNKSEDLIRQDSELESIIANYDVSDYELNYTVYMGFVINEYVDPLPIYNITYLPITYKENEE